MIVIQVRGMICYARGEMYTAAEVNTIMCRRNRDGTVVTIEHKRTQMLTKDIKQTVSSSKFGNQSPVLKGFAEF